MELPSMKSIMSVTFGVGFLFSFPRGPTRNRVCCCRERLREYYRDWKGFISEESTDTVKEIAGGLPATQTSEKQSTAPEHRTFEFEDILLKHGFLLGDGLT